MEGLREIFFCLYFALFVSSMLGWVGLYLLWKRELRGKPLLVHWTQPIRWFTWIILLAFIFIGTLAGGLYVGRFLLDLS